MMALPSSARTTSKQEDQRGGNQLGSAIARNIRKAAKIGGLVRNKSKMFLRTLSKWWVGYWKPKSGCPKFKFSNPKSMGWIGGVTRLGLCPKIFRFSTASVMPW